MNKKERVNELKGWDDPVGAREFLRAIRPGINETGFEIGLTGSVLFDGWSEQGMDLIIYPRNSSDYRLSLLYSTLRGYGLRCVMARSTLATAWRLKGSTDTKHVEIWSYEDRRVDLFFLR